jgi:small subunit ribosomal protein S20
VRWPRRDQVAPVRFGWPVTQLLRSALVPRDGTPPESEIEGRRVANIKSQLKRIRTNEKARLQNQSTKSALKTAVRRFREAAEAGDREHALVELHTASRKLDKAASKGVIHPNQAANRKSAMAKRVNQL